MKRSYYKKKSRIEASGGKHIPNKKEAKEIRKAKSQTGKTEEELRKEKYYRKLFSDAAKVEFSNRGIYDRKYKRLCKRVRSITGFSNFHPESIKELDKIVNQGYIINPLSLNTQQIIRLFGK